MLCTLEPISILRRTDGLKDGDQLSEPIFGGYANARGEISLFGETLTYRVNLKNRTVQQRPPLNDGAQVRYDDTLPGEPFEYCQVSFRRLDQPEIEEICSSGSFRVRPRFI